MVPEYDAQTIELKWQKIWKETGAFHTEENPDKPKKYVLEMFPYPSGDLHMGHVRNYSIGDAIARQARMAGFDVLHPIGWDAFGLPAENAAIKHNTHPSVWTSANIATQKASFERMGFSYDEDRIVHTCDEDYYRWGQSIFLKMWERGLVERRSSPVNWCEHDQTVLANEQVEGGCCWRCGEPVVKRELEQWYFKITDYAQELLDDLDQLTGWPDRVKQMQANWIGRSEGAHVVFTLADEAGEATDTKVTVFTTRPDTLFGCTFLMLAPEHPMLDDLVEGTSYAADCYHVRDISAKTTAVERQMTDREKHGAFTGRYMINPVNGELVPIWISDYVLMDYGTGAVMAVPSGDSRDFEFARKYDLPVPPVVIKEDDALYTKLAGVKERVCNDVDWEETYDGPGVMVQSGQFTGLKGGKNSEGAEAVMAWLEEHEVGEKTVNFRLRDWLISRQRFWGNPIPAIHCDHCGIVPVPEEDLPVILPTEIDLASGETLADVPSFYEVDCPVCGCKARRETDTMDTFTDSSWYYLRYTDARNNEQPFAADKANRWMPVDNYIGGIEHAIMHLLYSRFYVKVLRDLDMLDFDEPFTNLLTQGMVKDVNGDTMSKSKGNVVAPDTVITPYGADTMRLTILFVAPPEKDFDWDPNKVEGSYRFIKRMWRTVYGLAETMDKTQEVDPAVLEGEDKELFITMNRSIEKCTKDFARHQFNTVIAGVMEIVNAASLYMTNVPVEKRNKALCTHVARVIVALVFPIIPHVSAELFEDALGETGRVDFEPWPTYDEAYTDFDTVEIAVQILGKVRERINVASDISKESMIESARDAIADRLEGKNIVKVIAVPGKLVNFVVR